MADPNLNAPSSSGTTPPSEFVDAPPEEARGSTSPLLLALNIVILAVVIGWVIHRAKSGTGQPEAGADTRVGTASAVSGNGGNGGNDGKPITGLAPVSPSNNLSPFVDDDPMGGAGSRGAPKSADAATSTIKNGRRQLAARPRLDEATMNQMDSLTEAISTLGPSIEVIRAVSGAYPSSAKGDFGTNRGIEALTELLANRGVLDQSGLATGDTDGDGRKELLDPWGHALVYFSHDDYASSQDVSGVGAVQARERWVEDLRSWQGEQRIQLFSFGPNGKDDFGGYDDVNSWVSR
ncbi:MAG: hypothetical protein K8T90_17170 [Planctomycetes bacterium]|nr:hypothetical protein [Planctomycetota bacterium]